ncbi:MAG: PilZ domain-containing protein [Vicinamibacterales bacterium]|nr:PilZ domain-containing protein [Vicinamibacterales bacterium]
MSEPCTVIIGAQQHLDSLKQRADSSGEVLTFTDEDALAALAAITARRPQVITLERLFAATSRGAALINRIKDDPMLASSEIRVVSHDGSYSRVSPRRAVQNTGGSKTAEPLQTIPEVEADASLPPAKPAPQLDYRGTRRAPRFRMIEGTEAQLDGGLAKVIDLSVFGAQVLSQQALKPQQRIRIVLADDLGIVRLNASVAWASFEIPKGVTRYRAGVEFKDPEAKAVEAFCMRHKAQN